MYTPTNLQGSSSLNKCWMDKKMHSYATIPSLSLSLPPIPYHSSSAQITVTFLQDHSSISFKYVYLTKSQTTKQMWGRAFQKQPHGPKSVPNIFVARNLYVFFTKIRFTLQNARFHFQMFKIDLKKDWSPKTSHDSSSPQLFFFWILNPKFIFEWSGRHFDSCCEIFSLLD